MLLLKVNGGAKCLNKNPFALRWWIAEPVSSKLINETGTSFQKKNNDLVNLSSRDVALLNISNTTIAVLSKIKVNNIIIINLSNNVLKAYLKVLKLHCQ